jgi:hypothetical protein
MKPLRAAVTATMVYVGCGGHTDHTGPPYTGNSTIDSTIPSLPAHTAATGYAAQGLAGAGAGNQISVIIFDVANVGDVCTWAHAPQTSGNFSANMFMLLLLMGSANNPSRVVTPGTYPVGDPLSAGYFTWDSNCQMTPKAILATSGMVDVSGVSPSFTGDFVLTFPNGRLVGHFDAPLCPPPTPNGGATDAGSGCASYPACGTSNAGSGPCLP